jgi:Tol biopolymer transport system component
VLSLAGEASDAHFARYEISVAPAAAQGDAATAVVSAEQMVGGTLGVVPLQDLAPGDYIVRLRVLDQADNESSTELPVHVEGARLIRSFVVTPSAVSPEPADGIQDAAVAAFSVLADVTATLEVLDASGMPVALALPPTPVSAGALEVSLGEVVLSGLPDGAYEVRLSVSAAGLTDVLLAPLVVDRVPPAAAITQPTQGAWVRGGTAVAVSVSDPRLTGWQLLEGPAGGPFTEVASGHGSVAGPVAVLTALPDGARELRLVAVDVAGNATRAAASFQSDATPPRAELTRPASGSVLSRRDLPFVSVEGIATDAHLQRWTLTVVRDGASRTLATGTAAANGSLAPWDLSAEGDGPAELVLRAEDAAGNVREAHAAVTIDLSPPIATLASPRGTVGAAPLTFQGTVSDGDWKLELSDGFPGTAFRFVTIASGSTPVSGQLAALATLPADGAYTARLTATDHAGNVTVDEAGFAVDTAPPSAPPTLVAAVARPNDVTLSWGASAHGDISSYRVMRSTPPGTAAQVSEVPAAVLAWIDRAVPDGTHRYVVVAVDRSGWLSDPSPAAEAAVDATPPTVALASPAANAPVSGLVAITGTVTAADLDHYTLFAGEGATPTAWRVLATGTTAVTLARLGTLDVTALAQGSTQTIRLEAADRTGNVGSATVSVKVDNVPPTAPVLLSASVQGANVTVTWAANHESDLAGYVLFRNGAIANAPDGASPADVKPYLLSPGTLRFVDVARPDGTFTYQLQAVDAAGNLSALSNALSVSLDTHPPTALIVSPAHLGRVDGPLLVTADCADQDVASVRLEARAGDGADFVALAPLMTKRPYTAPFDPAAYASPVIEVRAVATDVAGKTDPAPRSVFVFRDPPLPAPTARASTDGTSLRLDFESSDPGRVSAYQVYTDGNVYAGTVSFTGAASASSTAPGVTAQGAFDGSTGTYWQPATPSGAQWQVILSRPILVKKVTLSPYGGSPVGGDILLRVKGVWVPIASALAPTGSWVDLDGHDLEADGVRLLPTTTAGNAIRVAEVTIAQEYTAVSPYLTSGYSYGYRYDLEVDARSAFGQRVATKVSAFNYQPYLDQTSQTVATPGFHVTGRGVKPGDVVALLRSGTPIAQAIAGADGRFAADATLVPGSNVLTAQATDAAGNRSIASWPVTITYAPPPAAAVSLTLTGVTGSDVSLAFGVSGDLANLSGLLVRRTGADGIPVSVATLPASATAYVDAARANGTWQYVVVPVNSRGFEGTPSNAVTATVGVTRPIAPEALAVTPLPDGSLALSWSFRGIAASFLVERSVAQDGPFAPADAARLVPATAWTDTAVIMGAIYFYRVRAVDAAGNAGPPSNVASGTAVSTNPPAPPVLTAPTVAGTPVVVTSGLVSVAGRAPGSTQVDVYRGGSLAGTATVRPFGVYPTAVTLSRPAWTDTDLSPDGRHLAYGAAPAAGQQGTLLVVEDIDTHQVQTILAAGLSFSRPRFSPDGRRVALPATESSTGRARITVVDLDARTLTPLPWRGGETLPAWSRDGTALAYRAMRSTDGTYAIAWSALADQVEHVIASQPLTDFDAPVWADAATLLAVRRPWSGDSVLTRVDLATGARTDLLTSWQIPAPIAVDPAGAHATVVTMTPSYRYDLKQVDLATGVVTAFTNDWNTELSPAYSPDGSQLAYFVDSDVVVAAANTGAQLGRGSCGFSYGTLMWSPVGTLVGAKGGQVSRVGWGGDFTLADVALSGGDNVFVAIGRDARGAASSPSAAIVVTWDAPPVPDLAVSAAVQPAVPIASQPASALVTVRNVGGAASPAEPLSVSVAGSEGVHAVPTQLVPPLAPGASTIVVVPIDLAGSTGSKTLWAVVDPTGASTDADRSNNTASVGFDVAANSELGVVVRTAPAQVGAGGEVSADVHVVNPGLARDVVVAVHLEDLGGAAASGVVAAELPLRVPPAGSATVTLTLNVGATLAGDYRVVAEVVDGGDVVARGTAPVTITADVNVALSAAASRAAYATGEDVEIDAHVVNASIDAPLDGATYSLELLDSAGAVVYGPVAQELPLVWLDCDVPLATFVPTSSLAPGAYTARARVLSGVSILAEATARFTLVARPLLVAGIEVAGAGDPPAVPAGKPAAVSAWLENVGSAPSIVTSARLLVLDPMTGAVLQSVPLQSGTLAPGATTRADLSFATDSLPLGTYALSLAADHDGAFEVLATGRFCVRDGRPPEIVAVNPPDGSFVAGVLVPFVRVTDDASGVASVTAAVGGSTVALERIDGSPLVGNWSGSVPFPLDGPYEIVISAADAEGNGGLPTPTAANPIVLHVVSDSTPPTVRIEGVATGWIGSTPVVATAVAADVNLDVVQMTVDGAPYPPGTPYAVEGVHVLRATAADKAGNSATDSATFLLDMTPPVISVSGVANGDTVSTPVSPRATAWDATTVTIAETLDGQPFAEGSVVSADGRHVFAVDAIDAANNAAHVETVFWIASTPTIVLGGAPDGAYVPHEVVPTCSAQGASSLVVTLDGAPYTCGTPVTAEGHHLVVATASSASGRTSSVSLGFTIDMTPPAIDVAGVHDGDVTRADVLPVITVIDANIRTWEVTVDGVTLPLGGMVTSEGAHELDVVARDLAGNEAHRTVRFVIDRTPPTVWASIVDGAELTEPVVVSYGATDDHLASVSATLDGNPFVSGATVDADGVHSLVVTARDSAGNEASRTYRFTLWMVHYDVAKSVPDRAPRVLARLPCDATASRRAQDFLRAAVPDAILATVQNDVDLLVELRTGIWNVLVLLDARGADTSSCPPIHAAPPLPQGQLPTRLEQEITEATFRGAGVLVFRTDQAAWPKLVEALGLQFGGQESPGFATFRATAVAEAVRLSTADGVKLKLNGASAIGTFDASAAIAGAVHGFGQGAAAILGFDPSTAAPEGDAARLAAGAIAYATGVAVPSPHGVLPVRIDVTNTRTSAQTRVREAVDPALDVLRIADPGTRIADGRIEWTFLEAGGDTRRLEYLVRLPETAGSWTDTTEVAAILASGVRVVGSFPLEVTLPDGTSDVFGTAQQLALDIPTHGLDGTRRKEILSRLASVQANAGATAKDRERAIGDLLAAVDAARALQTIDPSALRLQLDLLLAVWEARQ